MQVGRTSSRDAFRRKSSDPGIHLVDDALKSLGSERDRSSSVSDIELKKERKPVNYGSAAQATIAEKVGLSSTHVCFWCVVLWATWILISGLLLGVPLSLASLAMCALPAQ